MARIVDKVIGVQMERLMELATSRGDWKVLLEKRQHKFVLSCLENQGNLLKVAEDFAYELADMKSILGRIQRQLENSAPQQISKEQIPKKAHSARRTGVSREEMLKKIVQEARTMDLAETLPKRLAECLQLVMETGDVGEVAKRMAVRKQYVFERILGRKNPRKPSERGVMHYIETHRSA